MIETNETKELERMLKPKGFCMIETNDKQKIIYLRFLGFEMSGVYCCVKKTQENKKLCLFQKMVLNKDELR